MADQLEELRLENAVRVVVLTGAGEKTFCSGGDLELTLPLLTGARLPEDEWDTRIVADRNLVFRSGFKEWEFPKPIIAAINGHCLAGGFEMMLGTDIRIAAEHSLFGLPEAKHGLVPFAGALARLTRQMPQAVAMELMLTGATKTATELAAFGLLNRVLPQAEVVPAAMDLAAQIAANGPLAVREIKAATLAAQGLPLADGFEIETKAMDRVMATQDAREGTQAFMDRRVPIYHGR